MNNQVIQQIIDSNSSNDNDKWKPLEINEHEEIERVHWLRQRENLLRGLGVGELVNKMLSGTNGTTAMAPPANPPVQHHQHHNREDEIISISDVSYRTNNNNSGNHMLSAKYELKAKNYNPFENQSLFAEVIFCF